ncbi:endo-1,4-beta-xylanase [Hallella absiana]|uniref:endo-1,4-beta-xylanase n=1 Tax=Hallella absiana TaxID=2925336 RepID=UPI0021C7B8B1|nr:endo-1,4-beta-xylanase [Hallella absiana]
MNKSILFIAATALMLSACADDNVPGFSVDEPAYDSAYAYLDSYAPLKEYLAQSKNPNVHLGVGTSASDYIKKGVVYALTNSNFTETEPGNAMKMASCVNADGDMNFETVENYVNAATDAGLSVYGHTLAWHSQQPVAYLNKCIADKMTSDGPAVVGWTDVKKITYKDGKFGALANPCG